MGILRSIILQVLMLTAAGVQASSIVLNTYLSAPYQIRTNQGLEGSSVRTLKCIFRSMQQPFELQLMPRERAIYEVEQTRADGFFSAIHMARAEPFARRSAPLALEKWYWYSNRDPAETLAGSPLPRTGAIRGSNQLAWLREQGVQVDQLASSTGQLLRLLDRGRIDRFIADQRTLRTELTQQSVSLRPGFEQFYKYATLGVYFSNAVLEREPLLLQRFNREVFYCLDETPTLNEAERVRLATLHGELYGHWPQLSQILEAAKQQNTAHAQLTLKDIIALDNQWLEQRAVGASTLADVVLGRPVSRWLRTQQRESSGLITEVILTDRHGLIVAASESTTDYWQGDEAKFSEAFFSKDDVPYLGALNYDQSSEAYQVHISVPVRTDGEVIGVLIIGLNIERALLEAGLRSTL